MRGIINDRILKASDLAAVYTTAFDKVDCAYLITEGVAPYVAGQIRRLESCANRVVVLHGAGIRSKLVDEFQAVGFVDCSGHVHEKIFEKRSSQNPTAAWNRRYDIPSKRAFALEHARMLGFEHVFLVDDDILFRRSFVPSALDALRAGADIVCTYALHYADVSTMERVRFEQTGEPPEVSISGNCMLLRVGPTLGVFPYIYNEDWLFFWSSLRYGGAQIRPIQTVVQRPPRPGRSSYVRMEQFGELVVYLLFIHENGNSGLSRLRDLRFVRDGMVAYRSRLSIVSATGEHGRIVNEALSACDSIRAVDVAEFASRLEQEIEHHYDATPRHS